MTINRAALAWLGFAALAGAALLPFAVFGAGLAVAPPLPAPAASSTPPLIADALWARADGGRATALTPITPLSMARLMACIAIEDFKDTTPGDARRVVACRHHQPAIAGLVHLSTMQMRDAGLQPSFREGLGRLSTTIWTSHAWSRNDVVNALASRGEFGAGVRGVEAAARGYFSRNASELTLAEAAMVGALLGDRRIDPWCEPESATLMRNRILERMRDDGVIGEADFTNAAVAPLALAPLPEGRPPCRN